MTRASNPPLVTARSIQSTRFCLAAFPTSTASVPVLAARRTYLTVTMPRKNNTPQNKTLLYASSTCTSLEYSATINMFNTSGDENEVREKKGVVMGCNAYLKKNLVAYHQFSV